MSQPNYPRWWPDAESELRRVVSKFFAQRESKLDLPAEKIVKRKNPFLFRAKAGSVDAYATALVEAFLSSSEETVFGQVLEDVIMVICKHAKGGRKSGIEDLDLEYDAEDGTRVLVQIKSGTNWGNAAQRKALKTAFQKATRRLRQGDQNLNVKCIEGCCYGPSGHKDFGTHIRLSGNDFWREISGCDGAGEAVLRLIGEYASNGFQAAQDQARDRIVEYLESQQIVEGGEVLWDRLLALVLQPGKSGKAGSSDEENDNVPETETNTGVP